jgi:putative peptidoglycan lipid II flippase
LTTLSAKIKDKKRHNTLIKTQSYLAGISYSIALNIISKGLLFFTNLLIAFFFGANSVTDLYFYLLSCILLIANFIIGINGSVIVPESRRLEHQAGKKASFEFVNLTFYLLFATLFLMCFLMFLFPVEVLSRLSNFDKDVLQQNKNIIHLSTLLFFVQIVVSFFNDLLVYYRYFILPSVITSLNGILTVIFIWLFHEDAGLASVIWASILSYFISLVLQAFLLLKFETWSFFVIARRIERRTFFNAIYSIGSIAAAIVVTFIPLYFLSTYAAGSITQLILAQRIAEIPNTLLTIQFVTIIGVQLTEGYMTNDLNGFNQAFVRAAKAMYFVLIPVSVFVCFLSGEIVIILLQHGALQQNTSRIDDVLAILMIGVPFTGLNYLTSKALAAAQKIKAVFYFNLVLSTINIILSYVGISFAAQIGYAWAVSAYGMTYFLLCFFLLSRVLPAIQYGLIIKSFAIFLLLNAGWMFVLVKTYHFVVPSGLEIVKIAVVGFLYLMSVLLFNFFTKINPDVHDFIMRVINKVKTSR